MTSSNQDSEVPVAADAFTADHEDLLLTLSEVAERHIRHMALSMDLRAAGAKPGRVTLS